MNHACCFPVVAMLIIAPRAVASGPSVQDGNGGVEARDEESRAHSEQGGGFSLSLEGGAWFPRLGGFFQLGSGDANRLDLEEGLDLDDVEPTPVLELTMRKGEDWRLRASWFNFETDDQGVLDFDAEFGDLMLNSGDRYQASTEFMSAALTLAFEGFHPLYQAQGEESRSATDLRIMPTVGARYISIEQSIQIAGEGQESADGDWIAIYGGAELLMRYEPRGGLVIGRALEIQAGTSIGPAFGGDGGWVWHARGGLTLEMNANFALEIGYRLVELNLEDGSYEFDAGLQGLFLGAVIRF